MALRLYLRIHVFEDLVSAELMKVKRYTLATKHNRSSENTTLCILNARVGIRSKTLQLLQHLLQMFSDSRYEWSVASNPKLRTVKRLLRSNRGHCLSSGSFWLLRGRHSS